MAFYIKVTRVVADALRLTDIRNKTADGNVLLWQADIAGIEGDTVFDRAEMVGGVCLSPQQAKEEIEGTENPVQVTTPDKYKQPDASQEGEVLPDVNTGNEEVLPNTGEEEVSNELCE